MTTASDLISQALSTASSMQESATSSLQDMVSAAMGAAYTQITPGTVSAGALDAVPRVPTIRTDLSEYMPDASDILGANPELQSEWATTISTHFPASDLDALEALFDEFMNSTYLGNAKAKFVADLTRTLTASRTALIGDFAGRGFSLPGGAVAGAVAEAERDAASKLVEFECTLAAQFQDRWFGFVSELSTRYLEARRAMLEAWIRLVTLQIEAKLKVSETRASLAETEAKLEETVASLAQERYRTVLAKTQIQANLGVANAQIMVDATRANSQSLQAHSALKVEALKSAGALYAGIASAAISSSLGVAQVTEEV